MRRVDARTAWIGALVGLALTSGVSEVAADEPVALDWIAREPGIEVAVSVAALASHTVGFLDQRTSGWGPSWRLAHDPVFATASDLTGAVLGVSWQVAASYALDVEYFDRLGVADPTEAAGRTTLVDLQAVVLATGISVSLKKLIGRCRPRGVRRSGCREHDGFPSGHTVMPSALAGTRLVLALRSGDAPERYGAFALAESMSLLTAAFRMLAGAHSWEDVLGGWAIGHATGSLLSLAHPTMTPPLEAPPEGAAGAAPAPLARPWSSASFVWSSRF